MLLKAESCNEFNLRLKIPVRINDKVTIESRQGFIIILRSKDDERICGIGECAPLSGLHEESLEDCKKAWEAARKVLVFSDFSSPEFADGLPPSLAFAIDQALLTLRLKADPLVLKREFGVSGEEFSVPVNGLLIPSEHSFENTEMEAITESTLKSGVRAVKVKVGRFPRNKEIALVKRLAEKGIFIRLDGNRLLDAEDLRHWSNNLKAELSAGWIEYFEEPLSQRNYLSEQFKIYEDSPMPIALDESLKQISFSRESLDIEAFPRTVCALVIKPTALGSLYKTRQLMRFCEMKKLKAVLSSTFDSGWTVAFLALLAQQGFSETAMGLDTYRYLEEDLLDKKLDFLQGRLRIPNNLFFSNNSLKKLF